MKTLRDIGEDAVIARITRHLSPGARVLAGPGDDCAVVESPRRGQVALLKTDCLVEGIHYAPGTPAGKAGWKAVARVLSDFAAMGGRADHLLATVVLPPDREIRWVEDLYRGMDRCAQRFGAAVVGGETSSLPSGAPALVSIAATAWRKQLTLRDGGKERDALFVTGTLGGSSRGSHLTFDPRLEEAEWLTSNFRVHCMMDLSDGLGRDLPRLAAASGCGFSLDRGSVPRRRGATLENAIGDGEDYELLFAVAPRTARAMEAGWKRRFPALKLTRIGALTPPGEGETLDGGWDHFG